MKPRIVITMGHRDKGERLLAIRDTYGEAIQQAGGLPLYAAAPTAVSDLAEVADGLLLSGGGDCDSRFFREAPLPEATEADRERDRWEIALIHTFRQQGKPLFGICRGLQMINIALGGTIYQDLTAQQRTALAHNQAAPYDRPTHRVTAVAGSYLAHLWQPVTTREVNSVHHQAVKKTAAPLTAAAYSDDGLVEALAGKKIFACQWHPEWLLDRAEQRALFNHFVETCRQRDDASGNTV